MTSKNVIAAVTGLIARLNEPALELKTQWGDLLSSESGRKIKANFMGDFRLFCEFLQGQYYIFPFAN